jgi:hypothetical protein
LRIGNGGVGEFIFIYILPIGNDSKARRVVIYRPQLPVLVKNIHRRVLWAHKQHTDTRGAHLWLNLGDSSCILFHILGSMRAYQTIITSAWRTRCTTKTYHCLLLSCERLTCYNQLGNRSPCVMHHFLARGHSTGARANLPATGSSNQRLTQDPLNAHRNQMTNAPAQAQLIG